MVPSVHGIVLQMQQKVVRKKNDVHDFKIVRTMIPLLYL